MAMVDLLLGARSMTAGAPSTRRPSRRRSIAPHGPRPDGPRSHRAGCARFHPAARAHPDRPVAHRGPLGLLAADPRRAGDPRRARALPGGRRERAGRPDAPRRRARSGVAGRTRDGERPPHRHGLRLVSHRLLPGRGPHRPPLDRRPGRRADPRGDRGSGGVRRAAGHHRRDRDRQAVGLAVRGARPSGGRPGVAGDRAGDHDPRRPVRRRPRPAPHLRGGGRRPGAGRHRPRRFATRSSTTTWRSSSAARTSSSTSSGCRSRRPSGAAKAAWSSCCASSCHAAMPIGCC